MTSHEREPDAQDRIEKQTTLRAPVARVWRALTDAGEFGRWFGIRLEGPFVAGHLMKGTFEGTLPDESAMRERQRQLGVAPSGVRAPGPNAVFCTVERIEPERYFSFRWIPYGIDAEADLAHEATTLVEFRLEAVPDGTHLTIVESGFHAVPAHRRKRAFLMNEGGWTAQLENIARHVQSP